MIGGILWRHAKAKQSRPSLTRSRPKQARLKELEKNKLEAENSEIVDIVRGLSISLEELPLVLQQLREGTSGQSVQKSGPVEKEEN